MTRCLGFAIAFAALLLPGFGVSQEHLSAGDVFLASYQEIGVGEIRIPKEVAVFRSNGDLLRVFDDISCNGLYARSATQTITCSAHSRLHVLDPAGTTLRTLLEGQGFVHLGEVAPSGGTETVVAESNPVSSRLVLIGSDGEVRVTHAIPRTSTREVLQLPIESMDLLPDRCTLVYTVGWHYAPAVDFRRVGRFDVCSGRALPDLFRLPESVERGGGIRVLPNGDILVATGFDTRRFNPAGQEKAIYYGAAWMISLTPDGTGFWAAARAKAQRFSLSSPFPVSAPIVAKYNTITAMAVVDEWRAAAAHPRRRATARR